MDGIDHILKNDVPLDLEKMDIICLGHVYLVLKMKDVLLIFLAWGCESRDTNAFGRNFFQAPKSRVWSKK